MSRKFLVLMIVLLVLIVGCSQKTDKQFREISWVEYLNKIDGGLLGQMIGVQFGAPTEGLWTGEIIPFDLDDYYSFDRLGLRSEDVDPTYRNDFINWKKIELNGSPENDDVYIELLFLHSINTHGLDLTSRQIADDFIKYIPRDRVWCANAAAWDNITKGIYPPESGHPKYGWASDDIDFQIEADLFGLISPGLPNVSNDWCWKFGHVMNYGDGVYGGVFVAAMYTAAFFEKDIHKVIEHGLVCIPDSSNYAKMVRDVIKWHSEHKDWKDAWQKIYDKWYTTPEGDLANAVDVRVNGAYILMGLLYGEGDFWKTMNISMRCGMDSDCNPSNAVGILGCILGTESIPEKWKNPMKDIIYNETLKGIYPDVIKRKDIVLSIAEIGKKMVLKNGGKFENDILYIPIQKPVPVEYEQSYHVWLDK